MLGNLLSINLFSRECVRKFYQALVVKAVIHVVSFVKIHIFPYLKIKINFWPKPDFSIAEQETPIPTSPSSTPAGIFNKFHVQIFHWYIFIIFMWENIIIFIIYYHNSMLLWWTLPLQPWLLEPWDLWCNPSLLSPVWMSKRLLQNWAGHLPLTTNWLQWVNLFCYFKFYCYCGS